jgi:ParB-like chromosome segregation protein Spo0J
MTSTAHHEGSVGLATLGERLSPLRLCDAAALRAMRRSLEEHGQLSAVTLFEHEGQVEILDGFKRVQAARALGWPTLLARIDALGLVDAKLRLLELHGGRGLAELEEAWVVRSLYRDDGLSQPEIARRMDRHKSWVCRRLMLAESLCAEVRADVRLGLLAPRAAAALSRLPRGNQQAASLVVVRRGLTVQQTERLVGEALDKDPAARAAMLARHLAAKDAGDKPGPRAARVHTGSDASQIAADVAAVRRIVGRLEARLLATPLCTFEPGASEILRDALSALSPVLVALGGVIGAALREDAA